MIRKAELEDLPKMETGAKEFYGSSRFLRGFDISRFCAVWTELINAGVGTILLLDDNGIQGAIGGVAYPDINSGELAATEFFWFVRNGHRGGGMELYKEFERWARAKECKQILMIHLLDSMPEKLAIVYRRLGFEAIETHYAKEL